MRGKEEGQAIVTRLSSTLKEALEWRPTSAENIPGVQKALSFMEQELKLLGFDVRRIANENGADILIAWRDGVGSSSVGLFGHVDVETTPEETLPWISGDPWQPTELNGRLYCRGIGDNLGPLFLRLLTLQRFLATKEGKANCPPLFWLIHGEEEVGSPFAHTIYPTVRDKFPDKMAQVGIWLEETGYFLADGTQRVLLHHQDSAPKVCAGLLKELGGNILVDHRYLNKAFGMDKCPCLTHLIDGSVPYLAIGPNDVHTNIHEANESIPISTIALSADQFERVLRFWARNHS